MSFFTIIYLKKGFVMENVQFLNTPVNTERVDIKGLNTGRSTHIAGHFQNQIETAGENEEISLEIEDETLDDNYEDIASTKSVASVKGAKNKDTKDGKIGNTKQGLITGDCWLLSGVNALSYTKEGKKLIKDALDYQKDGTMVHLKGVGDYWISNKELNQKKKNERLSISSGDDDMIILEMAVEKVRDELMSGKLMLSDEAPSFFFTDEQYMEMVEQNLDSGWSNPDLPNGGVSTIEGGLSPELIYWITGKTGECATEYSDKESLLDKFVENKNKNYTLNASMDEIKNIKDVNGKKVNLYGPHAYAVKSADDETVTITNPHDSSKDIVLSRKTFLNTFPNISGCDLSDKNEYQNYFVETAVESEKLEDGARKDTVKDMDGNILRENTYDKKGNIIGYKKYLQSNGELTKELNYKNGYKTDEAKYEYREDGSIMYSKEEKYSKGKIKSRTMTNYYENGQPSYISKEKFTKNKKVSSSVYKKYNQDGVLTSKTTKQTNKDGVSGTYEWLIYNDSGVLTKSTESVTKKDGSTKNTDKKYDTDGNITYAKYEYKDKNGNVTKTKIDLDGDGVIDETY